MKWTDLKINVYGSKKQKDNTENLLNSLELSGNEYNDRLLIQSAFDNTKDNHDVLYNGNLIWSEKRIITELTKIFKKSDASEWKMSDYLYEFLRLCAGSIAHYNKLGWINEYPTVGAFKNFFKHNEDGCSIVKSQPGWEADTIKISKKIIELLDSSNSVKFSSKVKKRETININRPQQLSFWG